MQSQQKGLNQEKTHCFQNRYNTAGDSTICSHMMPYEDVSSKWREVGGTCAAAAAYTVTVLGVNRGLQSLQVCHCQLSTVLKFTPKELWQWKFSGEKRTKENSWLDLIDVKSLQCNNRWTIELLTVKGRRLKNGKEKRTLLFSDQVALTSWYLVSPVWIRVFPTA